MNHTTTQKRESATMTSTKLSRICDGIIEATWLAAIIMIPIFFNVYSSRIFEPDKITLLRTMALVILFAWVVKIIEQGGISWNQIEWKGSFIRSIINIPTLLPVIGLAAIYIVSTIFSVTPRISFFGSYQRLQGTYTTLSYLIIFSAIIGNLRRRDQVERIITMMIISSLPVSIYGILQKSQLDPVPWGGNVTTRIASNMGNSIFVAAYLIMVVVLAVGKIVRSLTAILNDEAHLWKHIVRATLYIFIFIIDLIAIIMSGSRGPFLGLFTGMVLLILLLTVYWRVRWATWLLFGVAILAVLFLIALNLDNGPLEDLRNTAWVGRFGHIFDTQQRTSQVRILIWRGASELVSLHEPLVKPDGSQDAFNFLRPFVGYGPESMYVAYNQFYPPELGGVEKRNASPDRSHNETWDSLVMTGVLGLVVYLWLFGTIFYLSLKWLRLIISKKQQIIYWILCIGGAIIGVIGLGIWQGWEFFGVGLPFGMVFGVMLYVGYHSLFVRYVDERERVNPREAIILMTLLAAVVSHFIEINFGIAIAVTRLYFWVDTALIILLGFIIPRQDILVDQIAINQTNEKKGSEKLYRKVTLNLSDESNTIVSTSLLSGILLVTLGYVYIMNSTRSTSIIEIIINSLTRLSTSGNELSLGLLFLFVFTWLIATLLLSLEDEGLTRFSHWLKIWGYTLGLSGCIALIYYIIHSRKLVRLVTFVPANQSDIITQADNLGGLLTLFYVYILLLILATTVPILLDRKIKKSKQNIGWVLVPAALIVMWTMTHFLNLRVVQADMTYKLADPFTSSNQWSIATLLYRRAISLVPSEDFYYLSLGRSYLEQAKAMESLEEQALMVSRAEEDLKKAQNINPLNTDHTANLARLYNWWASQGVNADERIQRSQISAQYYESATTLSPNNPTIYGEWAMLLLKILGDHEAAYDLLSRAIDLDPNYNYTQGLMGEYYLTLAKEASDETAKEAGLNTAINFYRKAVQLSVGRDAAGKYNHLIALGNVYIERSMLNPNNVDSEYIQYAIDSFLQARDLGASSSDLWRIEETIARLYAQKGDISNAVLHANYALQAAPETQVERLQSLLEQLNTQP